MVAIDIVVIILLLACIGYGVYAGFITIFFGFASIIVGSLIAGQFYVYGSNFLPQNDWTLLFSFALIFFVVSFLIMLFGKFMGSVFEKMLLKSVDKILGALFTLFLGALMLGIIYNGMQDISPDSLTKMNAKKAKVVQYVYKFDTGFFESLPNFFQKKLKDISPKKVEKKIEKISD
jgi:uncharacterized membrane protein required for colicin V production